MELFETVKLAATLVLAIPAAIAGIELFVGGETLFGGILLVLAVVLVVAQQRLTLAASPKGLLAGVAADAVTSDRDEDAAETGDAENSGTD
ncbi:DUF7533 family protein [Natronobiforma cellulositropha]|uniref:DUF7533 family protein n=1 Tax=Natronobiforma cellulositropha TaxID=1679076 RepID=UPI0021D60FC6|nr:hypothetical protein [Natronobiforma cellulositropha]